MRRRRLVAALVVVAYALLLAAWVAGNPPGATPDEEVHYTKALAAGHGELRGAAPGPASPAVAADPQLRWMHENTRVFSIPRGMSSDPFACLPLDPAVPARCVAHVRGLPAVTADPSYVGTYQPALYAAPGVVMRATTTPVAALLAGRSVNAALCLVLIAIAVFVLVDTPAGALAGVLVAVTPMALFLAASPSANGPEVAAGVCLFAAVIDIARRDGRAARAWVAGGVAGIVLASARTTSPLWIGAGALVLVAYGGGLRGAWARLRAAGALGFGVVAAEAVAVIGNVAWQVAFQPATPSPRGQLRAAASDVFGHAYRMFEQTVGIFGPLRVVMSNAAYLLWAVALVGVVAAAIVVGRRLDRVVVVGALVVAAVASVVVAAGVRATGFGFQARYVLPLLVAIPLLAADVLARRRAAAAAPIAIGVAGCVAVVQAAAWYENGRRYAVGIHGPWLFAGRAEWSPAGGWYPWIAIVAAAAVLLVAAGFVAARSARARPVVVS